jgi:hypothetical protein
LPYDTARWKTLFDFIFKQVLWFEKPVNIFDEINKVKKGRQIGTVKLDEERNLAVFIVEVNDSVVIAKNRVQLRDIAAKYIDQHITHGALVIYFSKNQKDYRFSFIAKQTEFTEDGELIKSQTHPKRFTYVLGENESCTTAAKRLLELAARKEQKPIRIKDVIEAFSVEKLNNEFFKKYKEMYVRFNNFIIEDKTYRTKIFKIKEGKTIEEKIKNEKPIRDFTKKLLGRIVFLHFLQKKGWLGCPADSIDWKDGDKMFMQNLFTDYKDKSHFHSTCLNELFFDTLNNPKRKNLIFSITKTRVPYLNGGLFDNESEETNEIDFPELYFKELLEFFEQYNFTIDENSHEDHEVGIDPEMLGHIFENLLEENKDKGTFYTPKEIVHYMCQESIIQYLRTHLSECTEDESPATKAIERLIRNTDKGNEKDKTNYIVRKAKKIEDLLDAMKVCDPAIGSGAFPMGILQEILRIKNSLDLTLDRAEAKKKIIQNTIYGVDIEKGAVDIARLRFWLALVVDEEVPHPLPNLDYRIMQGDSLLESYEGIDLSKTAMFDEGIVTIINPSLFSSFEDSQLAFGFTKEKRSEIKELMNDYFIQEDKIEKEHLHKKIDRIVIDHIDKSLEGYENQLLIRIAELELSLKRKKELKQTIARTENEIEKLKDLLAEKSKARKKLIEFEKTNERPYFLWHLYFEDVMSKGGFDIVIGNPPYIRQELIKHLKPQLEEAFTVYNAIADFYTYFYEQSYNLLKRNGISTFITSNNWIRANYGKNLRKFFLEKTEMISLVDFDDVQIFDSAIVATNILIFKRNVPSLNHQMIYFNSLPILGGEAVSLKQNELEESGFSLQDKVTEAVKRKIMANGIQLKDWNIQINYGIKSGLNDAFYIDDSIREQLIKEDIRNKNIIRPILRGRNISRYYLKGDGYLLFIPWHFPLQNDEEITGASKLAEKKFKEDYPSIYNHLLKFKDKLSARNQAETGIRYEWYALQRCAATYYQDFDKEKLVWLVLSDKAAFAIDTDGNCTNDSTFILVGEKLRYLCAILNSKVSEWYFDKIAPSSGMGTNMWKKYKIELLPIPELKKDEEELKYIKLVDKIIANKKKDTDSSKWENKIDAMVFHQYNLTEEEMVQVLNSFKDLSIKDKNQIQNEYRNIKFGKFALEV